MARLLAKSWLLASCLLAASIFLLPPQRTAEEASQHHDSLHTWIGHKSPKGLALRNVTTSEALQLLLSKRHARLAPVFRQRLTQLRRSCRQMAPSPPLTSRFPELQNTHWSVSPHRRLVMCRTAKHGSTTWSNYFVQMFTNDFGGSRAQATSRRWEDRFMTQRDKHEVIQSVQSPRHDYFSFFVCRNPVAKLLSTYKYNLHRSGFPEGFPSWDDYLLSRASAVTGKTGMMTPLWRLCDLCHNHWDAVIHMETFHKDSYAILKASGLDHISLVHMNNHGAAGHGGVTDRMVRSLFKNSTREVISYVLDTYENDFLLCGYYKSHRQLKKILKQAI